MSEAYDAACEVCAMLDQIRQEFEWSSTGPGQRERIATAALQGMLASQSYSRNGPHESITEHELRLSHHAVRFADALSPEVIADCIGRAAEAMHGASAS